MKDLTDAAVEWIASDPDAGDRQELGALVDRVHAGDVAAAADLADRFTGPLEFGTAGLRGRMGAGPNRMNTAVVTTATAGLCAFLKANLPGGAHLVVGYDARHRSAAFAKTVAGVATAAGVRVLLLPRPLPTPVLAFALLRLRADAGVNITASHNPAADNGYKVYLGERVDPEGGGAQLTSPFDRRIYAAIRDVGPASTVPVAASGWEVVGPDIVAAYVAAAAALVPSGPKDLRIALTAMHGVGADTALKALTAAGFTEVAMVASQTEPDPDFPTTPFPNPEEDGALDQAIATAREVDAELVIALDPDADRCAVAIPDSARPSGWRQLSGDQIGCLLGEQAAGEHAGDPQAVLARSFASSSTLDDIAGAHGLRSVETLTGFKWIVRPHGLVYGYEEAIGYCVAPGVVRDKDGITAALKVCELAARLRQSGRTLDDALTDLCVTHGLHETSPLTVRVEDLSLIRRGMVNLRAAPPAELAGAPVIEFADLRDGRGGLGPTDAVLIVTARRDKVVVRPSGTEPKLKCYLEVVEPVAGPRDLPAARAAAAVRLEAIKTELRRVLGI